MKKKIFKPRTNQIIDHSHAWGFFFLALIDKPFIWSCFVANSKLELDRNMRFPASSNRWFVVVVVVVLHDQRSLIIEQACVVLFALCRIFCNSCISFQMVLSLLCFSEGRELGECRSLLLFISFISVISSTNMGLGYFGLKSFNSGERRHKNAYREGHGVVPQCLKCVCGYTYLVEQISEALSGMKWTHRANE